MATQDFRHVLGDWCLGWAYTFCRPPCRARFSRSKASRWHQITASACRACALWRLRGVDPESWAERVGVEVGDKLRCIDREWTEHLTDSCQKKKYICKYARSLAESVSRLFSAVAQDQLFAQLLLERPIRLIFDAVERVGETRDTTQFTAVAGMKDRQLGFRLASLPPAPYLLVQRVEEHSWAFHAGVQEGDHLMAVYRKRMAEISAEQFLGIFKGQGPRPLRLTFSRLKRFTVTITTRENQMGLQTNGVPPAAFLEIRTVDRGKWGEQVGVFVGDALVAVNGVCLDSMSRREFIRQMKEERPLSLTIDRNHGGNSLDRFERFTVTAGRILNDTGRGTVCALPCWAFALR